MRLQTIKCAGPTRPRGIFYTRETPKTPAPVPIDSRGLTRSRSQGPVSSLACTSMFPLVFSSYVSTHSRSSNVCGCFFLPNLCDWHQKVLHDRWVARLCCTTHIFHISSPLPFCISLHFFRARQPYIRHMEHRRFGDIQGTNDRAHHI